MADRMLILLILKIILLHFLCSNHCKVNVSKSALAEMYFIFEDNRFVEWFRLSKTYMHLINLFSRMKS